MNGKRSGWDGLNLSFDIPILTSFVLNRCRSWGDLISVLEEIRESRRAEEFRKGLNELLAALNRHDNVGVDAVITELDGVCKSWSQSLGGERQVKKVNMTVPILSTAGDRDTTELDTGQLPCATNAGIHPLDIGGIIVSRGRRL